MGWWRLIGAALAGILFFHGFCSSERPPNYSFVREANAAPDVSYYDYIIVGGGTAGCPLAATLSQRSKVLLLERGGSPYFNRNVTDLDRFVEGLADTSPGSPSQPFVSEDGVLSSRPRVLGGASAINAGFYSRAQSSYVRGAGWEPRLVEESFRWVESVVAFEPQVPEWQAAFRDGLVESGVRPYNGFTYDHLLGTKIGGTIFDKNRKRHTSADLLQYANPSSLTVLLRASVHNILFRTQGESKPVAYGVIFRDESGAEHRAYLNGGLKNEIILSAGALGSPQLLMISGVGPKQHLQSLNVEVILDQPLVGQQMRDNPMNTVFVPSPRPVEITAIEIVGITRFGSYIESSTGLNLVGGTPSDYAPYSFSRGGYMVEKVMGPLSFGHLELRNLDPNDNPSVRFNYFQNPIDLQRCVKGVRTILRVIESRAFSKFKIESLTAQDILEISARLPQNMPTSSNTTKSLEQYCRDTVRTIWHYHGGCQVGRVVDGDYKVLGVNALRIVDGSTFSSSPGTNPQATVMMLGRYMGVKILREAGQVMQ